MALDANQQITYLAKCDRTYCARRHPPRGFFDIWRASGGEALTRRNYVS